MRLVYVTSRFPFGHGEGFLIPELLELLRLGHEVRLVPVHNRGPLVHLDARRALALTEPQPLISSRVAGHAIGEFYRSPKRAVAAAGQALGEGRLSIRLRNAAAYPKGLFVARAARDWRATHIHAYWAASAATIGMIASATSNVPWSFTGHRWDIETDNLLVQKLRSASAMRVISNSSFDLVRRVVQNGVTTNPPVELLSKVRKVHLGVAIPDLIPTPTTALRMLCPASFVPIKGHTHLLDALAHVVARLPTTELLLAGDGSLRTQLVNQARELGILPNVTFLGALPREALLAMYSSGNVRCVVLPSITLGAGQHEGIPVSLMEAMAYGVPVVATQSGGIPELVTPGAGLLVPPGDAAALARALHTVLTDSTVYESLRTGGRLQVAKAFNVSTCVNELLTLIDE